MKASIVLGLGLAVAVASVSPGVARAEEDHSFVQAQINKEFGKRFDRTAATVRSLAAQAVVLHRLGRHDEETKKYDEAAKLGGIRLQATKKK